MLYDVGPPLKFTPEAVKAILDEYFFLTPENEWTITTLAIVFGGKQLLYDYSRRDGYKEIIENARRKIERSYEMDLRKKGRSGDIFALKNFGWRDTQDVSVGQINKEPWEIGIRDVDTKED